MEVILHNTNTKKYMYVDSEIFSTDFCGIHWTKIHNFPDGKSQMSADPHINRKRSTNVQIAFVIVLIVKYL